MSTLRKDTREFKRVSHTSGVGQYVCASKPVVCPHCGHNAFREGEAQLNKAVSTFFGFDWLNETATVLVCEQCGHILWFRGRPRKSPDE